MFVSDRMCDFHPGHQLACHLHNLPRKDFGLLSYFARNAHFSQLWSDIENLRIRKRIKQKSPVMYSENRDAAQQGRLSIKGI